MKRMMKEIPIERMKKIVMSEKMKIKLSSQGQ